MRVRMDKIMTNCYIITVGEGTKMEQRIFSYESHIMTVSKGKITEVINGMWDFSVTTSKHLNEALRYLGIKSVASMSRVQKEKYFKENGLIA